MSDKTITICDSCGKTTDPGKRIHIEASTTIHITIDGRQKPLINHPLDFCSPLCLMDYLVKLDGTG